MKHLSIQDKANDFIHQSKILDICHPKQITLLHEVTL